MGGVRSAKMKSYKYLVVGGGIAGQRTCHGIRRIDQDGTIALIAGEDHLPRQRPPLFKGYLLGKEGLDRVYLGEEAYYAENEIDVITGVHTESIDRGVHGVALDDGRELKYEKLLLPMGRRAWSLTIAGNDPPAVFTLRTIEDSDGIRQAAGPGKRALVVGGSFMIALRRDTINFHEARGKLHSLHFPGSKDRTNTFPCVRVAVSITKHLQELEIILLQPTLNFFGTCRTLAAKIFEVTFRIFGGAGKPSVLHIENLPLLIKSEALHSKTPSPI